MALFDQKQKKELARGLGHCGACKQLTDALRAMGAPNEVLEEQNEANTKIIQAALKFDEEFTKSTNQG